MSGFVHLHVHTEYSLLDGACRIDGLIERVKALGQTAVAITDHGVMYGAVEFYKAAKKAGIKPILGCEVYVAPRSRLDRDHRQDSSPYHLVLLCENEQGYQNLIRLVSIGSVEGFYGKPRVDRETLMQYHEGLICLSACLSGEVNRRLTEENYSAALEAATFCRDTFGAENYFLELQNHGLPEQARNTPGLSRLSRELGVGLVATNDCHYLTREDARVQKILLCIQTNHTLDDDDAMEFPNDEFYVKSSEEMAERFSMYPDALENTVRIAERCNFDFRFHELKLPYYQNPEGGDNFDFFRKLCAEGLLRHYGEHPSAEITERLAYETGVIRQMGFIDYYLIVWDFIHYAKGRGIPVGPGRGSGEGSLCAYCMGITDIDPVRYNLLFERFLNPERVSMPDFDIDFCYVRRGEVIDYVVRRYGEDHVAQIITFGTMAARAAVRDVGRVMGLAYATVDGISKLIPRFPGATLDGALRESEQLRELYGSDDTVRDLIDTAKSIEGFPRHASTHAAGVVITRDPADCYVPLQKNDEQVVTQYTMKALEELGLLKMDFLGLRNLTVIADAEKAVRKVRPDFSIERIPLDDADVFDMLSAGKGEGVFQFESTGIRALLAQMKPRSIEDLIAAISLYRPGPMDSIPTYIENRQHPERIRYAHPALRPILDVTYGCIVYQEQVMQVFRALAGYSYGRADIVRRAMAKKQHDVMEREREVFLHGSRRPDGSWECPGAVANGMIEQDANKLFDDMTSFASYAFNKSHAAAYSLVSYRTAFLKRHYPVEYWAALLTSVLDYTPKVTEYISECLKSGIRALPPDVNRSGESFEREGGDIRFGLLAIKGVGVQFVRSLVAEREASGTFSSLYDFFYRVSGRDFNRKTAESLIRAGALDNFGYNRRELLMGYDALMDKVDERRRYEGVGQMGFFGAQEEPEAELEHRADFSPEEKLRMEREVTGLYISGHPLRAYEPIAERLGAARIGEVLMEDDPRWPEGAQVTLVGMVAGKKEKTSKNGARMAFVDFEDETGAIELIVFPTVFQRSGALLRHEQALAVVGKISVREDEDRKLIADWIVRPEEAAAGGLPRTNPSAAQTNLSVGQEYARGGRTPTDFGQGVSAAEAPPPVEDGQIPPRYGQPAPGQGELSGERNPSSSGGRPGLFLRVDAQDSESYRRVTNLLEIFEGQTPVYFRFVDTGKLLAAPRTLWTSVCPVQLSELKRVLGDANVVYRA